jgi:thymidylate kinase
MSIEKIVITGGPCAGKSTALSRIQKELTQLGYKVLFVSESATEFITNGLTPWEYRDFQHYLMRCTTSYRNQ